MDYDVEAHEVLSTEKVFDGHVIKVFIDQVRLPDGRTATWERVAHPGAVGMVPLTDEGEVIMVRQYRHAVRGVILEIPAGKLDPGEPPFACATRELAEEIGMKAAEMVLLSEFYNSPGYSDERFFLFVARGLSPEQGQAEDDEFLELVKVPLASSMELISTGQIRDAKSIIGLTLARSYLDGLTSPFTGGA
ncbi:MAG TPA: NUDIX hydrolase [Candidatus Anoxymicrobiaceae bacterium]|jgi:ADP-ribose pyrophosphatase